MSQTLYEMRKASRKTVPQIIAEVKRIDPSITIVKRQAVINWEIQGIRDVRIIDALVVVYGQPLEAVKKAAVEAKAAFREKQGKKNAEKYHSPLTV